MHPTGSISTGKKSISAQQAALMIVLLAISLYAHAVDSINTTYFGNLAVEGYDTVAYFTQDQALKGSKKFETKWQGANWRFASQRNLDLFKASPDKYAPQFGGYCAYAVSQNRTASIEPDKFLVLNGKLYLNYNKEIQTEWLANRDEYIADADRNWPQIVKK